MKHERHLEFLWHSVSSLISESNSDLGTNCVLQKPFAYIMADDREEENTRINVVVKTSKNKETIETESTATILEVVLCFNEDKLT